MGLTFIHLSDIHFSRYSGDSYDLDEELRNAIEDDITSRLQSLDHPTIGVLVTGDIAFSGKDDEYRTARIWLERLCGLLQIDNSNIWLIPGNHDVDRSVARGSQSLKALHERIRSSDKGAIAQVLQELYRDDVDARCLFSPFAQYNDFAKLFGCDIDSHKPFWKTEESLGDNVRLCMWGLNSVIVSDSNDRQRRQGTLGSLVLGTFQIPPLAKNVVNMTLCHHPPDWFRDESDVSQRFDHNVSIQLFGHTHDQQITTNGRSLRLVAGAVHPERGQQDWTPVYNILSLAVDTSSGGNDLLVTVYPRVWDGTRLGFRSSLPNGDVSEEVRLQLVGTEQYSEELNEVNSLDTFAPIENSGFSMSARSLSTGTTSLRNISFRYIDLSYLQRIRIAQELDLLADADEQLKDRERLRSILYRVDKRQLWDEFLKRIEHAERADSGGGIQ